MPGNQWQGRILDSVKQGGNYDGVLGVLTAMEAAETIVKEKIPHRHPITGMPYGQTKKALRFEPAMMSSGVICGKFDKAANAGVGSQGCSRAIHSKKHWRKVDF